MKDLIEALTILLKYGNPQFPTHCEHDIMLIMDIDPDQVSDTDKQRLDQLGFDHGEQDEYGVENCFYSYHFGSA